MKNNQKIIPKFKNENQERQFWSKNDISDYIDQFKPINVDFSELKPSTKSITVRLPESLLSSLKILAHQKDVPYQSLLKVYLSDRIKQEIAQI